MAGKIKEPSVLPAHPVESITGSVTASNGQTGTMSDRLLCLLTVQVSSTLNHRQIPAAVTYSQQSTSHTAEPHNQSKFNTPTPTPTPIADSGILTLPTHQLLRGESLDFREYYTECTIMSGRGGFGGGRGRGGGGRSPGRGGRDGGGRSPGGR